MTAAWRWTGAVVLLAGIAATVVLIRRERPDVAADSGVRAWDPLPRDVDVEVLNGSSAYLGARNASLVLRRARLDVVAFGTATGELKGLPRTTVFVRRRDTTGVGRVREALGEVEVVDRYDASREVDLSVVLGLDYEARNPRPR
jgi:hypothetical protein